MLCLKRWLGGRLTFAFVCPETKVALLPDGRPRARDAPALARKRVDEASLRRARPPLQRSVVLPALPRITLGMFRAATLDTNGQSVVDAGAAVVVLPVRSFGGQLCVFPGVRPRRRVVERPAQPGPDDDAI